MPLLKDPDTHLKGLPVETLFLERLEYFYSRRKG
jgi:hypothetical protein